jgi:hypothetical protein
MELDKNARLALGYGDSAIAVSGPPAVRCDPLPRFAFLPLGPRGDVPVSMRISSLGGDELPACPGRGSAYPVVGGGHYSQWWRSKSSWTK